jgi:hypothetical protein
MKKSKSGPGGARFTFFHAWNKSFSLIGEGFRLWHQQFAFHQLRLVVLHGNAVGGADLRA